MHMPNEPEAPQPIDPEHQSHASTLFDLRGTFVFSDGEKLPSTYREHNHHAISLHRDYLIVHTDTAVTLYHVPTHTRLWRIICPSFNFAFHQQQQLLALAPGNPATSVLIWDLRTGQVLHQLTYEPKGNPTEVDLGGLAFSPDGNILAAGMAGDIVMWETTTGRWLQTLPTPGPDIYTIAFHPSKNLLAAGSFNAWEVWMWELSDGSLLHSWDEQEAFLGDDDPEEESDRPYHVDFTLDGKWLLAGRGQGGLHMWNIEQACEVSGPHTDLYALTFTQAPDGRSIAVCDGGIVRIFEFSTWRLLHEFVGEFPSGSFSPDGQVLATLYELGNVLVWEVATEKLLGQVSRSENDQLL